MKTLPILSLASLALLAGAARANDFPTLDRVLYVHECMRNNPGPHFEMVSKCSCALDRVAESIKHEDYVNMATIVNAMSIGGERGGELRDNDTLKPQVQRYREVQSKAARSCFINTK